MAIRSVVSSAVNSRFSSMRMQSNAILLLLQFTCLIATAAAAAASTTTSSSSQRIAEGQLTTLGEYPSALSLGLTSWANVYHLHICTGSILTENWAITSARCVEDAVEDVERYYWLAGTNNLRQQGAQHAIREILIHPGYNPNDSLIHDVALVKVKQPFEFSATIQPIELPITDISVTTSPGTPGVVVGWGQVSQTLIQPDVLRSADVTILDVDICREVYAPWNLTIFEEYQFCALTTIGEAAKAQELETPQRRVNARRACRGDEGGPLFLRDANIPSIILGFVSWTYGCDVSGYPAVYTKISAYYDWITEITGYWR